VAIGLGLLGVVVLGLGDLRLDAENLPGDAMALLCAAFFTAYFLVGRRLRARLSTSTYVTAMYGVAALTSAGGALALGQPMTGFDGRTWLAFALLALIPTMIGHTSMNHALRWIRPGRLSTATLSEPPLAGLVAWLAWDEAISAQAVAGYLLTAASVAVLAWDVGGEERKAGEG
jgi:drug/metabolite transporter (DMT)-like permease